MRAQLKVTRLSGRLGILGLVAFMIGLSFTHPPPQKPDDPHPEIVKPEERAASTQGPNDEGSEDATKSGKPSPMDMKAEMRHLMGPYTPREFYPSLMQLPDLSPAMSSLSGSSQVVFNYSVVED